MSAGKKFRNALKDNKPLIIPGTINAYSAILAEKSGHQAIYLSGGGVAAASYGMPDLGITSLEDVLIDAKRITNASSLPLLVDIDTGWGGAFNISRTIKSMIDAGCGAVHMEDQVSQKRCGHRPNKSLVSKEEMTDEENNPIEGLFSRTDDFNSLNELTNKYPTIHEIAIKNKEHFNDLIEITKKDNDIIPLFIKDNKIFSPINKIYKGMVLKM